VPGIPSDEVSSTLETTPVTVKGDPLIDPVTVAVPVSADEPVPVFDDEEELELHAATSPKVRTERKRVRLITRAAYAMLPPLAYYLIKSEPSVYPWSKLVADRRTAWTGVRNYEARNTLRAMKKGDACLYYHSNEGKEIVGVAKVVREAYLDPTAPKDEAAKEWCAVEVAPWKTLKKPLGLAAIKAHPLLKKMKLVTRSRISCVDVTPEEYEAVLALTK
jgi:predicted RNA-binding protein with PUA-like domain